MSIYSGPNIVNENIILHLDASNLKSYPGTGTTWTDLSDTKSNGTISGSPTYDDAVLGSFVFTQGSSSSVSASNNSLFYFLNRNPYTLELAVKITALPANNTWRRLIHRESNPGTGRDGYNFWVDGNANGTDIGFYSERWVGGTNVTVGISVPYATTGSQWNHWVITYSGSELRMYRNGALVNGPNADVRNITNNTAPLYIGNSGGSASFGGNLANVKIYSVALSAAQVLENFEAIRGRYSI